VVTYFYLGTHQPGWLTALDVPLFVSHRRLATYRVLPRARTPWALDSGGFTELTMFGEWRTTAEEYVAAVARYDREIGMMEWAAPQDWMCEPSMLARTGLTVAEHQWRTLWNFLELGYLWHEHSDESFPFIPVLQGWTLEDYVRHADLYKEAGVALGEQPIVGLGSVCRRQRTSEIAAIVDRLSPHMDLHGFGVKGGGLSRYGPQLSSVDSMAWSLGGRWEPGCRPNHKTEANCLRYALAWRRRALQSLDPPTPQQEAA